MIGTKLLLILVPILLVEAQHNSPWRPSLARRLPFFRPGGRPGPFTGATSVPVVPTVTEHNQIVTVHSPPVPPPKDSIISSTQNVKPTELTIVYPENYKPASTSPPPVPSFRGRGPVRLPLYHPRPTIGSSYIVPTTPQPPAETSQKPIESVVVNIVASAPPSNELVISTEKQPEIAVIPISTEPIYIDEPISKEPISEEPITKEPISEEPISKEPISIEFVTENPVTEEPVFTSNESDNPRPTTVKPLINRPLNWHIIPVPTETQRPLSTRSPIIIPPPEPVTQKPIENVQPAIVIIPVPTATHRPMSTGSPVIIPPPAPVTQKPIESVQPTIVIPQRPPVSELPIEIKPVQSISENISPNMDVFNPPVSSGPDSGIVIGGNRPSRQPAMIWHPVQQKPRTTLVPTTTEIYEPTITQKPKKPVSAAKPWSQPVDNTYTVNRLHDYICKIMDGYESVLNKCDTYIECKSNLAFQNTCPDGLHFNPSAQWPEYPCGYPSEVQCRSQDVIQEPQPSDQCPHRYGFYPMSGSDCGQYIMCQEGLATVMSCPPGLAFSPITSSCDWPANVPGCSPLVFREYTCPPSAVDKYGRQTFDDSKFRYGKSCKKYIVCHKGNPRLLSCDAGMAFDEQSETCVDADQVMDCHQ